MPKKKRFFDAHRPKRISHFQSTPQKYIFKKKLFLMPIYYKNSYLFTRISKMINDRMDLHSTFPKYKHLIIIERTYISN